MVADRPPPQATGRITKHLDLKNQRRIEFAFGVERNASLPVTLPLCDPIQGRPDRCTHLLLIQEQHRVQQAGCGRAIVKAELVEPSRPSRRLAQCSGGSQKQLHLGLSGAANGFWP